jgi:hypothetical protein
MAIGAGFPFPESDKGKQEQVDREKAQVNRSLERLYFLPISPGSSRWIAKSPMSRTLRSTAKLGNYTSPVFGAQMIGHSGTSILSTYARH